MSTSEILDRTFFLYRNNFLLFAGIAALPAVVALALHLIGLLSGLPSMAAVMPEPGKPPNMAIFFQAMTFEWLILILAFGIGGALAQAAATHAISQVHLGKPSTIATSYNTILSIFWRIIGIVCALWVMFFVVAMAAMVLVIGMGMVMAFAARGAGLAAGIIGFLLGLLAVIAVLILIVYLSAKFLFSIPVCVVERTAVFKSFSRSSFLTQGTIWRIILVFLLLVVVNITLSWILAVPSVVVLAMNKQHQTFFTEFWSYLAQAVSFIVSNPIAMIAYALFYFDQRVRKEALDLQLLIDNVEQSPPSPGPAPAPSIG